MTDPDLSALADAYGVATSYENWAHEPVEVAPETVVRILAELGVDASTPDAVAGALADAGLREWRRLVAPTVVVRQGEPSSVLLHVRAGSRPQLRVRLEKGPETELPGTGVEGEGRTVEGTARVAMTVLLPADLPLGWHTLSVEADDERAVATLVVAPGRVALPPALDRAWGWMVQLYSVRSAGSWGLGDYADLAELVRWSGAEHGAGVLLCNPLHAPSPVLPMEPSPYYPSSRRFRSPLYLRVEQTPEYAAADAATRAAVDALRVSPDGNRIDRDEVWTAKLAALELLWPGAREDAVAAFRAETGAGLEDFALFCALAERHGVPWQEWPAELHRPRGPAAGLEREVLADRVDFHAWLQLLCDEQLAAVAAAASAAGMPVGVVHDLAVGVDAGGADGWALQDDLAIGVTVGAPPDSFNQQGQDWRLPPWRPDRLPEVGYAPYRDMLRGVLRHAGGVRIDHVMGLFRLWWVPEGYSAAEGSYVRYDAEALLGVLALEADRAGALVVGEDLGTVEPVVTSTLAERGVLGSAVLWFEKDPADEARFLPPDQWRELAVASVTTHDLPTAAGFLAGEQVRVRGELGLLGRPVQEEQAAADAERAALLDLLGRERLVGPDAPDEEIVLAMHALLTLAPSRLVLAALGDAVGDLRQPNLPGTTDEYPSWRLPVAAPGADDHERPLLLAELLTSAGVRRLCDLLRAGVRRGTDTAGSGVRYGVGS
ncbi:MAG: 4-alpha-glucanotransferase [Actinomycetota bacterium]|nr:4-alpha-glucanotransferase [Actinomycetota bacterium]